MMIVYNLPAHRSTAAPFLTVRRIARPPRLFRPPGASPDRRAFFDRPAYYPTAVPDGLHPYRDIRMLLIISMTMTMIRSGTIRSQYPS